MVQVIFIRQNFHVKFGPLSSEDSPFKAQFLDQLFLPLDSIFRKHKVSFHCFADDLDLPLHVTLLTNWPNDVEHCVALNFLKLNNNKTEMVVFGL